MRPWHLFSAVRLLAIALSLTLVYNEATQHERAVRLEHAEMLSLCPDYASRLARFGEDCASVHLIVDAATVTRTLSPRLWRHFWEERLGRLTVVLVAGPWLQWLTQRAYHWMRTCRDAWRRHFTTRSVKKVNVEAFIHRTVHSQ